MDTALSGLIIIMILLLAVITLSYSFLSTQEAVVDSWQEMEERMEERVRTDLLPIGAVASSGGSFVDVTLRNEGSTKLTDFDQWDVIVQYDSTGDGNCDIVDWFSYDYGEWSEGIGDIFEPGIFNPGEVMTITIAVSPEVTSTTTNNRVIIATPNGITARTVFTCCPP